MAGFFGAVDMVNRLAESAPGFKWRLRDESKDPTLGAAFPSGGLLINLSVWDDVESLRRFTYEGDHLGVMKRRKEWFRRFDGPHMVLWWVKQGHHPSLLEARERLDLLHRSGPTASAFTFHHLFEPPA